VITSAEMNPGLAQTEAQVRSGLVSSQAKTDAQQAEARQFITEHGAAASGGHTVRAAER